MPSVSNIAPSTSKAFVLYSLSMYMYNNIVAHNNNLFFINFIRKSFGNY